MPDPTPTAAEALAALDHENHDFVDEGDGRSCPVCEAAPTLRALAEQPRAVFSEALLADARTHQRQRLASEYHGYGKCVCAACSMAKRILDAAGGERVRQAETLQPSPEVSGYGPAPPEAGVDTGALHVWAALVRYGSGWTRETLAHTIDAAAAELDALRTREHALREERDDARRLADENVTWLGSRCAACGHRVRPDMTTDTCPQCETEMCAPWNEPEVWPEDCDCERCVDARAALNASEESEDG